MQRYRINYRLLFGITAGSIFVAAFAFFVVHPWQLNRKATWFRDGAEQALSDGKLREAYDYQYKYVRYRPEEDDARIKLAHIAVDITESGDVTGEDIGNAYQVLDDTVRRTQDSELRKDFADLLMAIRKPEVALVHIKELLALNPDSSELKAMQVKALFLTKSPDAPRVALDLIGYDKESKEFVAEKAYVTDQPDVYALLANSLLQENSGRSKELGRRVIDQMTAVNPDSYDAHLKRSLLLFQLNETEQAKEALEKAYNLAPTELAVLQRKGQVALSDGDYESAEDFFQEALKLNPDHTDLYKLLAQTKVQQDDLDQALAIADKGIERSDPRAAVPLVIYKISLLLAQDDVPSAKKEIEVLSKTKGLDPSRLEPLVAYQRARVKYQQKKWQEAAKELNQVRPQLLGFPSEQAQAGALLGQAYEKLGSYDLALQAYEVVLNQRPGFEPAEAGKRRMERRIRPGESTEGFNLGRFTKEMLARPEEQQDWEQLDQAIAKAAEQNGISDANVALMRAQVFLERKKFPEAKELIQEAAKSEPDNLNVKIAAIRLVAQDPSRGIDQAMNLLDRTEQEYGDSLQTRVLRSELISTQGGEDVVPKLQALTDGLEQWSDNNKAQLYSSLGLTFQRLNKGAEALEYWKKSAELMPNNLPVRMHLFELALQLRDEAATDEAQEKILQLVGSKNDASYILTEVKRRLFNFSLKKAAREEVIEARAMLDVALEQRPEWSELHALYGQLLVLLDEEIDLALKYLDNALKYGPANVNALALQVQLLHKRGLDEEARVKLSSLPNEVRERLLGGVEADILLATGDKERAFEAANRIASKQPDVPATQQWFANMARETGHFAEATQAYERAIELSPTESENWLQLLSLYMIQNQPSKLESTFQAAQLALDDEYIPLLTAKSFELRGAWRSAERIYLATFAGRFEELAVARRMADFYLLWTRADANNLQKAGKYVNIILRAGYEGKIPHNHPQLAWARMQAARQLVARGEYQDVLKAERVLEQGAVDGKLPFAYQTLLAEILSTRRDPASQEKARTLFYELEQKNQLQKRDYLILAQLLRNANQWQSCEEIMLDAISSFGADTQVWATYIGMLIDREDYSDAQLRLNRFKDIDSQGYLYSQLQARLAAKQGNRTQVQKSLKAMLPNLKGTLTPEQLQVVRTVANLAIECNELKAAENLYELYVKHRPNESFELVRFRALHGDIEAAMADLKEEFPLRMDEVLMLSTQMLRQRRSEFGDRFDEEINRMVGLALRDAPDSAQRQLYRAEILEIQQKYQESAAAYDKLLARSDVPQAVRAAAMNNQAFLLAELGQRLDEAETMVNEAMETFGPIGDLLDTRGLVRIASEKYELAIEDLSLAVSVEQDPVKYFHLARAQLEAKDEEGASESWKEAQQLGLEKKDLPMLEQSSYDELAARLGQLGGT